MNILDHKNNILEICRYFFRNIVNFITHACASITEARKQWKNKYFKNRARYIFYYKHFRIKNNQILYEAFCGRGMLCNPYALFLVLFEDPRFKDLQHIWVLDNIDNHLDLIQKYNNYNNVHFVQYLSNKYLKYLCTAKYVINNSTFPTYYTKKEGQTYINTWHGIPLKTLGFDMPNGITESANIIRNFMQSDYILSSSPAVTDLLYKKAYKLEGIWPGKVIEEGYPRLDTLFRFSRDQIIIKLRAHGVEVDTDKKILLYAPTWQGKSFSNPDVDINTYRIFKEELEKHIDISEYQILIKVHQIIFQFAEEELIEKYFIPATIDANEILSIADVLITDYSSIYFDYLATGRPILFYMPGLEEYKDERGIYKSINTLPGPVTNNIIELSDWINNINQIVIDWHEAYEQEQKWSGAVSDGHISKRVIDCIFFKEEEHKVYSLPMEKKKLLIAINSLSANSIGTAFLDLLHTIDYNFYDVSVMAKKSPNQEGQNLLKQIPSEVRVFYRNSPINMTRFELLKHEYRIRNGFKYYRHPEYYREFIRCYGAANFDYVLDFNGYDWFYTLIHLQAPEAKTGIWLHNDMYAECNRLPNLKIIFKMYSEFDSLISCSQYMRDINRNNLAELYNIPKEKFHYAIPCIDYNRLKIDMEKGVLVPFRENIYISLKEYWLTRSVSTTLLPYYLKWDDKGNRRYRFVTVGKLDSESNQIALIRAFNQIHIKYPSTILYIIGDGALNNEIIQLLDKLSAHEYIVMVGNITNPLAVMKYCDCLLYPSSLNDQSLIVFDALALNIPVIISNNIIINNNDNEIIEQDINGTIDNIYSDIESFINKRTFQNYPFNLSAYNEDAYRQFLIAIGETKDTCQYQSEDTIIYQDLK